MLYSGGDGLTGRVGGTASGYDSQACQRNDLRGFVSNPSACRCQNIKCSSRGSSYGGSEPMRASSEAEARPRGDQPSSEAELLARGRPALERGEISPEGVSSPRARRGLVSVVLRPSSEAVFRSRAAGPTALVGRWSHQGRGPCRMDLPGPTTTVGTRTDYSVGPWDYPACATWHLMAWSTGTTKE
jgi:hypothetical protein